MLRKSLYISESDIFPPKELSTRHRLLVVRKNLRSNVESKILNITLRDLITSFHAADLLGSILVRLTSSWDIRFSKYNSVDLVYSFFGAKMIR